MRSDRERDAEMDRLLRAVMSDAPAERAGACPAADELAAYAERSLSDDERHPMEVHLASCPRCQAALGLIATMPEAEATAGIPTSVAWWRAGWKRWLVPLGAAATAVVLYVAVKPDAALKPVALPSRESVVASAPPQLPASPAPSLPEPAATPDSTSAAPARERVAPSLSPAQPSRLVDLRAKKEAGQRAPGASKPPIPRFDADPETTVPPARPREFAAPTATRVAAPLPTPPPPPPASPAGVRGQVAALPSVGAVAAADVSTKPVAAEAPPRRRVESVVVTGESPLLQSASAPVLVAAAGNPKVQWSLRGPRIARSDDGGQSWHVQYEAPAVLLAGSSASDATCWAVGTGGLVVLTTDGQTWEPRPFPERVDLTGVTAAGGTAATVTTRGGRRFGTEDGGSSWTAIK